MGIKETLEKIAIVDIEKKLITGVQSPKEQLHEEAHLLFSSSPFGQTLEWLFQSSQMYLLGCIAITFFIPFFRWIDLALFIFMLFCLIYEEYWVENHVKQELESFKTSSSYFPSE